jgi:hypothetical protein
MPHSEMNQTVRSELNALIPRGPKGSVQDAARMVFWALRMNSLGSNPEVPAEPLLLRTQAFAYATAQ